MKRCLTDDNLELLLRNRASWWRAVFWQRHLQRCCDCRERMDKLQDDERFLQEFRRVLAKSGRTARSSNV